MGVFGLFLSYSFSSILYTHTYMFYLVYRFDELGGVHSWMGICFFLLTQIRSDSIRSKSEEEEDKEEEEGNTG